MREMRPGMTVDERKALRQAVQQREVYAATDRARLAYRSMTCQGHGDHATCKGEAPGNGGCLCLCHDDADETEGEGKADARPWDERHMTQCNEPHLGLATTRQLLDEIAARIEVDGANGGGGLGYTTVGGRGKVELSGEESPPQGWEPIDHEAADEDKPGGRGAPFATDPADRERLGRKVADAFRNAGLTAGRKPHAWQVDSETCTGCGVHWDELGAVWRTGACPGPVMPSHSWTHGTADARGKCGRCGMTLAEYHDGRMADPCPGVKA